MLIVNLDTDNIRKIILKNFSKAGILERYCEEKVGASAADFLTWGNVDMGDMPLSTFLDMYFSLNEISSNITDFIKITAGEFVYVAYKNNKRVDVSVPILDKTIQKRILEKNITNEEFKKYIHEYSLKNSEIDVDRMDLMFVPFKVVNNQLIIDAEEVECDSYILFRDIAENKFRIATIIYNENSVQVETYL